MHLMRILYNLNYIDGKPIAVYLNEFQNVFIQLKNMEITCNDEVQDVWSWGLYRRVGRHYQYSLAIQQQAKAHTGFSDNCSFRGRDWKLW